MAIKKAIKSDYGVYATYWNVAFLQNNFIDKVLYVKLFGYSDAAVRQDSATPLMVIEMTWREENYPGDINRQELYALIKLMSEFTGAEDI